MRLKNWLKRKKREFEAEMPIDNPDVKVVTTSYQGKPFFVGVGISKQREVKGSGKASIGEGVKGEYQSQKDLDWQLFYNLGALPSGFVPAEKVKDFMASTIAVTSGNASVYSPQTEFREVDQDKLDYLERNTPSRIPRKNLEESRRALRVLLVELEKKKKEEQSKKTGKP